MKKTSLKRRFVLIIALIMVVLLGGYTTAAAKSALDLVVKIRDLDDMLLTMDDLSLAAPNQMGLSPTDMLRSMLQGTDWIDPARLIVLGVTQTGNKSAAAILIPFQTANENFQKTFNAKAGKDYYLIGMPPGQALALPDEAEKDMVAASGSSANMAVVVEIGVSGLLASNKPQIEQWLQKIESMPAQPQAGGPNAPSPAEIREMMTKMLEKAEELNTITMGIDFNQTALKMAFKAEAKKNSELYKLFSQKAETAKLAEYITVQDITFQSLGYDVEGMLDLVDDLFGTIYEQMGIDFANLASLGEHFTGETAGGMSFAKDGITFEMLAGLKNKDTNGNFTETVYLPWLMDYSRDLSRMMEKELKTKIDPLFARTPDSTVKGHKVAGVKFQFPVFPMPGNLKGSAKMSQMMTYSFRMTTVGDLALMAPDDQRLGELIDLAATMKAKPSRGPLMQGTVDMSQYFNYIVSIIPEAAMAVPDFPASGRMKFRMDVNKGQFSSMMTIPMDGIKALMAYSQQMATAAQAGTMASDKPRPRADDRTRTWDQEEQPVAPPEEVPVLDPEKDPDHWFDKGGLLSTYGNDKAAIAAYQKAIELDPGKSEAHFNLGVSYGELGEYEMALTSINHAIELNPSRGLYYYGRARVYLLAGEDAKALSDFKQAAAAGNTDAQEYLNSIDR